MILDSGGQQSVIAPAHPFTRRASMSGTCGDFRLAAFAFAIFFDEYASFPHPRRTACTRTSDPFSSSDARFA
jgi:hypothetical protein